MLKKFVSGIMAGILIAIGGTVFLSCEDKTTGAVLFAVALLCICIEGYSLYTGRICYIPEKHDKDAVSGLFLGLLGNFVATFLCARAIIYAMPAVGEKANAMCALKLTQTVPATFVRAVFCGILIFLAVDIYKRKDRVVGILFAIPVFILSGYEHSIADMYYFAASGIYTWQTLLFVVNVLLGNTVGGMLLPVLSRLGRKDK